MCSFLSQVRVASPKLIMEEAPESYKDVTSVVEVYKDFNRIDAHSGNNILLTVTRLLLVYIFSVFLLRRANLLVSPTRPLNFGQLVLSRVNVAFGRSRTSA